MENLEIIINNLIERVNELENKVNELYGKKTQTKNNLVTRDKTKYMYNGVIYNKNKLVLKIVSDYVNSNLDVNFEKLSAVFDKSLQGSLGVVRLLNDVKSKPDANKRFFMDDIINLNSGEQVVVCTQWGVFNIDRFLIRAQSLGFNITKINN